MCGDVLGAAQARVELLEQEGEADAGEQADAEAEDGAAQRLRRDGRSRAPSPASAPGSCR